MNERSAAFDRASLAVGVLLLVGAVVVMVVAGLARGESEVAIEATGMRPGFELSGHDYTVSCEQPVDVRVSAGRGAEARIGAGEWRAGEQERTLELEPGGAVVVELRGGEFDGTERYYLRCLPSDFPRYDFLAYPGVEPGLWLVTPTNIETRENVNYAFVFDHRGVPVWWMHAEPAAIDAQVLPDGTIAWGQWSGGGFGVDPRAAYEIRTLDGELVGRVKTVGRNTPTDHHELLETSRGNYIVLSYRPRERVDLRPLIDDADATVLDSVIQELTPEGELVWEWSSADHIDLRETGRWLEQLEEPYDLTHINAVSELPDGDLLISMRNVDAVYRLDRETGEVEWKLGGTRTEDSLRVVGDPNPQALGAQHDVRWIGEDEITIFDNQTETGAPPRALRLRIEGDTARVVELIEDETLTESPCCGSARRAEDGSWLISWGGTPLVSAVEPDGERRFALEFESSVMSYRAVSAGDYADVERFRAGMSAQVPDAR